MAVYQGTAMIQRSQSKTRLSVQPWTLVEWFFWAHPTSLNSSSRICGRRNPRTLGEKLISRHFSQKVRKTALGYGFSEIVIQPTLKIHCPEDRERALDLIKNAETLCLVSRAIDTPLRFEPKIEIAQAVLSV
jgi:hypothetical protein